MEIVGLWVSMPSLCTPFEPWDHLTAFHETYVLVLPLLILIINSGADAETCESGAELASVLGSEIMYVKSLGKYVILVGNI